MHRLTATLIIMASLLVFIAPAMATEGFTASDTGKYEWIITKQDVLLINTSFGMTIDKESKAVAASSVEKMCNDAGKSIYGQVMKNAEVSKVIVTNRQIAVFKYGFPKMWDDFLPDILKTLDKISEDIK